MSNPLPDEIEQKDYTLTFFEACEFLNKSAKSVSRYVRRGILHPKEIKSLRGTREYRFSRKELEQFKSDETSQDQPGPDRSDRTDQPRQDIQIVGEKTGQTSQDQPGPDRTDQTRQADKTAEREMIEFLKSQIEVKDKQIAQHMERDRENNIILKNLHDKLFLLEGKKPDQKKNEEHDNEQHQESTQGQAV